MEKMPYLRKSGSTIIAIDAPAHGLSGGTNSTFHSTLHFDDISSKIQTTISNRTFTRVKPAYTINLTTG
jgi:hypothetical protein